MTMDEAERTSFLQLLAASARQATDDELATLLSSEWRARLTAAWLIGLDRREQFRARIGDLLLASEVSYAGQGYCFALARLGTTADAEVLAAYLNEYLPQPDKRYDRPRLLPRQELPRQEVTLPRTAARHITRAGSPVRRFRHLRGVLRRMPGFITVGA